MGAAVPVDFTGTCPRCKFLRLFTSFDGAALYRCNGCEWLFNLTTPAVQAAPAVPASTVNATNTSGTPVAVTISAGTLTAVTVNGVQVGTTAGTYIVPTGGTINITYTVAPTWTWALPGISAGVSPGALALPFAQGGTAFTPGLWLLDTGTSAEPVQVVAGATGTNVPLFGTIGRTHVIGVVLALLQLTPNQPAVELVPAAPGWGF